MKVWKTIKLGTGLKTANNFRRALKNAQCQFGPLVNEIIGKSAFTVSVSRVAMECDLCIATTAELTGKTKGRIIIDDVFAGIKRIGGTLCPAEVGPQLRIQYVDQPDEEQLVIAMDPIMGPLGCPDMTGSDENPFMFVVGNTIGFGLCLNTEYGDSISECRPSTLWVFVRPRK